MYCSYCGREIEKDVRFCPFCGNEINPVKEEPAQDDSKTQKVKEAPISKAPTSRRTKVLLGGISIVFILILAAGSFFFQSERSGDKEIISELKQISDEETGEFLAVVRNKDGKYGYMDDKWDIAIPCNYDIAYEFENNGLAVVGNKIDGDEEDYPIYQFGVVDKKGNEIVPCKYDCIGDIGTEDEYAVYIEDDTEKHCVFGEQGIARVGMGVGIDEEGIQEYLYGYIDETGREIISCQYNEAWDFQSNQLAVVGIDDGDDSTYGCIDTKGNEVVPFRYGYIGEFDKRGMAVASEPTIDSYGYDTYRDLFINDKGEEVVTLDQEFADRDTEVMRFGDSDLASFEWVSDTGDVKIGYINRSGEIAIDPVYDWGEPFGKEGLALVGIDYGEDKKYGFVNESGEEVIPLIYDSVDSFGDKKYTVFREWIGYDESGEDDYMEGVIDTKGEEILPAQYLWVKTYENSSRFSVYMKNEETGESGVGLIDETGTEIISPEYSHIAIEYSDEDTIFWHLFTEDAQIGVADNEGEIILSAKYHYVECFGDNDTFAAGTILEGLDFESDKFTCQYFDKDGNEIKTLSDEYTYAGRFVKVGD